MQFNWKASLLAAAWIAIMASLSFPDSGDTHWNLTTWTVMGGMWLLFSFAK